MCLPSAVRRPPSVHHPPSPAGPHFALEYSEGPEKGRPKGGRVRQLCFVYWRASKLGIAFCFRASKKMQLIFRSNKSHGARKNIAGVGPSYSMLGPVHSWFGRE